ncbi:MAG TPA: S-methyl-5'-thioadenosine phosphorylase [Thermoanaerobaculia bacterium]|nr:S-methyl-5'-thioadenosine phosphorylase [Thermoanaerobaculia bacterium]
MSGHKRLGLDGPSSEEAMLNQATIGVIGGSGLYQIPGLEIRFERSIDTPFGAPSDPYVIGELDGVQIAFLSRHGKGHRVLPSEINFRANIYGFKVLGVDTILSASAVGSLKEEYRPTDIVLPDQFIDRTRHRADTFFGNGIVAHVSFADPICQEVSGALAESGTEAGATIHRGGVYVCMEGPQFSTRAESRLYRSWNADVIGMTNLQEAKLAREAEICYATMALVTDYDCWREELEPVSVEQVIGYLNKNAATAIAIIKDAVPKLAKRKRRCGCGNALQYAILTDRSAIPARAREDLAPIIGRYL